MPIYNRLLYSLGVFHNNIRILAFLNNGGSLVFLRFTNVLILFPNL